MRKLQFFIFTLFFYQILAKKCEVLQKQQNVKLIDPRLKCTSFVLKSTGDYTILESIHISNQTSTTKEVFYDLFEQLTLAPSLREIVLSDNSMEGEFDMAKMEQLTNLTHFEITGHNISKIINVGDRELPTIVFLNLSNNKIQDLGILFNKTFPNIGYIDLSSNRLTGLLDLQIFDKLDHLEILKMAENGIVYVVYTGSYEFSNLRELHLSNNFIDNLDFNMLNRFKNLQRLELRGNYFVGTFDIDSLQPLNTLTRFSIGNQITKIVNSTRNKMPSITHIDFSSNRLVFIDLNYLGNFENLLELNLERNQIVTFRSNLPNNLRKLEYLNFGLNRFLGIFDLGKLESLPSLRALKVGNEVTRIINSARTNMTSVSHIDFSDNQLTFIDLNDFRVFDNLRQLHVQGNKLVSISFYEYAKLILPTVDKIAIERNEFFCHQLEKMLAPYKGDMYWYWLPEISCPSSKNVLYEKSVCCYPLTP